MLHENLHIAENKVGQSLEKAWRNTMSEDMIISDIFSRKSRTNKTASANLAPSTNEITNGNLLFETYQYPP